MAGLENSVASIAPFSSAGMISPAPNSEVVTPSFSITLAPIPKKRIRKPSKSATLLISLVNQPDVSGAMIEQGIACTLYPASS